MKKLKEVPRTVFDEMVRKTLTDLWESATNAMFLIEDLSGVKTPIAIPPKTKVKRKAKAVTK